MGDEFRLLFATSTTRNAQSSAIADYNSFVQGRAAAGHTAIRSYSAGFRVVGCTQAVDARDNTETTYTDTDKGVPVYWLKGSKVADDYEDFYDSTWDSESGAKNESGSNRNIYTSLSQRPFTGCNNDGTEDFDGLSRSSALGNSAGLAVVLGYPNDSQSGNNPLTSNNLQQQSATRPFYALSQVFRVGLRDDATLSRLEIGTGRRGTRSIRVTPGATDYKTWVPNDWTSATVQATRSDSAATVAITGDTDTATPNEASIALVPGLNTVTVTVTAEDTTTIQTYTVAVLRLAGAPAADAAALLTSNVTVVEYGGWAGYQSGSRNFPAMAPAEFDVEGRTYRFRALGMTTGAYDRFPADTVAACFVNDARHPKPSDAVRNSLKLRIGTHEFRFADATPVNAFQAEDCYRWSRPSGLNGWAHGDVALVKLLTAENTAATGRPGIDGSANVGRTLTATKGSIADANGTSRADGGEEGFAYSYQWMERVRGIDRDIPGATARTFELGLEDLGRDLLVQVGFKDDLGNAEAAISSTTDAVGEWLAPESWSTRLTPQALTTPAGSLGCDNAETEATKHCSAVLTNDRLVAGTDSYRIERFDVLDGHPSLRVSPAVQGDFNEYLLTAGTVVAAFIAGAAPVTVGSAHTTFDWEDPQGFSLTENVPVDVGFRLLNAPQAPRPEFVPISPADGFEVWSATLTPVAVGSQIGCNNRGNMERWCSNRDVLTDDDFAVDGADYAIEEIYYSAGDVLFAVDASPGDKLDGLTLYAGGTPLSFGNAELDQSGRYSFFDAPALTVGVPVQMSIIGPARLEATLAPYDTVERKNGELKYRFDLTLNEPVAMTARDMRDRVFEVDNGKVEAAEAVGGKRRRVGGRNVWTADHWRLRVKPAALDTEVTVSVPYRACGAQGALCTSDGKALGRAASLTLGTPTRLSVSVADAADTEESAGTINFPVALTRASDWHVEVDYETTAGGTATPGTDFVAARRTLVFEPGTTMLDIPVTLFDDGVDDDGETVEVRITAARAFDLSGEFARSRPLDITDNSATGTIGNSDPMPRAWLARFGRTVASQAVDAIGERMEGGAGSHVTLGGYALAGVAPRGHDDAEDAARVLDALSRADGRSGLDAFSLPDGLSLPGASARGGRSATARELLLGSSFQLSAGGGSGAPAWTAWGGRFATGAFQADVDGTRLDGRVTTGFLGADVGAGRWLAGVALGLSEGAGGYAFEAGGDRGDVRSSLAAVYRYARIRLAGGVDVWGLAGYGTGEFALTQHPGTARAQRHGTGIGMRMGALGARGTLLAPRRAGGLALALKSDAFRVRTDSGAAPGLGASEADVSRVRLAVAGSRTFAAGAGTLTPSLELGVRHDAGDAETGTGVEAGAGMRYARGALTVEGTVRALVAHEETGYREWGASASVRLDPGASGRGLALTLAPSWGAAVSGVDRLWSLADTRGLAPERGFAAGRRLEAEVGYGLGPDAAPGLLTPYAGVSLRDGGGRAWRTGWRWQFAPGASLSLEGVREEAPFAGIGARHAVMLRGTLRR